jgi:hypothetical protein
MKLHSVFQWIVAAYGLSCSIITLTFTFSTVSFHDFISAVGDGFLDNGTGAGRELRAWHGALQTDVAACSGVYCAGDVALHAVNLFFLFTYIPLCAMFAAFVLDQSTVIDTLFGDGWGTLFTWRREAAEMPALENASGQSKSGNRRRASSRAKRAGPQFIYDDTFGIIQKDILDTWNRPKKLSIDSDDGAPSSQPRTPLPPIRNLTPRPSAGGSKLII